MFGRATIRLGIGPHSSFIIFYSCHATILPSAQWTKEVIDNE